MLKTDSTKPFAVIKTLAWILDNNFIKKLVCNKHNKIPQEDLESHHTDTIAQTCPVQSRGPFYTLLLTLLTSLFLKTSHLQKLRKDMYQQILLEC